MTDVGELIWSGLPAGQLDSDTRRMLETAGFGGYLLLRRNVGSPDALAELARSLDRGAGALPPAIAIDEEGGSVSRLDHIGLAGPSALAIAATGDVAAAERAAWLSGRAIRALGINTILGPCLDVLSEPANPIVATRSFGEDAEEVSRFGLRSLRGYEAAGLAAVLKHFPGHGGTRLDSHVARAEDPSDLASIRRRDLVPFAAALGSGAAAVMSAHVRYPRATPVPEIDTPATLSAFWLRQILREELGFGGVVVSDALEMEGVAGGTALGEVIAKGLAAGVDVFLCQDIENAMRARGYLLALAGAGGLPAGRIGATIERLRAWRRGLARGPSGESPTRVLLEVAPELEAIQQGAVAMLAGSDRGRVLPLRPDEPLLCVLPRELSAAHPVDVEFLRREMSERFERARVIALEPEATAGEAELVAGLAAATPGLHVILGVIGHRGEERVARLATALAASDVRSGARIGVALHRPVDVAALPASWTRLVTYGFGRPALRALLDVLAGRRAPTGRVLGLGQADQRDR